MPARGFHVIVPPEYRRLGCLPAEQFIPQLMERRGEPYYVGLLSAAQYHGAAHHRPQEFQVLVERNRNPIECGAVRVAFIARKAVADVPTLILNTPRGVMRLSTAEATAVDLAGYPAHAGGWDGVATVLAELAEKLDGKKLVEAVKNAPLPWSQRLGYLLELGGSSPCTEPLAAYVQARAREYVPLATGAPIVNATRSTRWRLRVNATVEADA